MLRVIQVRDRRAPLCVASLEPCDIRISCPIGAVQSQSLRHLARGVHHAPLSVYAFDPLSHSSLHSMMLLRVGVPSRATIWQAVSSASVGLSAVTMTRRQSVVASETGKDVEYQTSTTQVAVTVHGPAAFVRRRS